MQILARTLQSSLASPIGDITLSQGYAGTQYLSWQHIREFIPQPAPPVVSSICQVRVCIDLHYVKDAKDAPGDGIITDLLGAISDDNLSAVDVVMWLLVVAMRLGVTTAISANAIIARVLMQPDLILGWDRPDLPVLCASSRSAPYYGVYKPLDPLHANKAFKSAARAIGITAHVKTHDLRPEPMEELSRIPE